MTTKRHLIYNIRELISQYSDDSDVSNEYISFLITQTRALLVTQRYSDRAYVLPQKIRQRFNYELELAEDNPFDDTIGTILRTVDPIQKPIENFNLKSNMRLNSGSYKDIYFTIVPQERFPYVGRNKWIQNHIYVTIGTDFRLYFTASNDTHKMIENVRASYVCEDPEAAYPATVDYDGTDFWDVEYPLEASMVEDLTNIIVKKLVGKLQIPQDKINNADEQ